MVSIICNAEDNGVLIFRIAAVHQRSSAIGNGTTCDGDAFDYVTQSYHLSYFKLLMYASISNEMNLESLF
jgi:hypothetical protein